MEDEAEEGDECVEEDNDVGEKGDCVSFEVVVYKEASGWREGPRRWMTESLEL